MPLTLRSEAFRVSELGSQSFRDGARRPDFKMPRNISTKQFQERPFAIVRRNAGLDITRAAVRLGISERWLRDLERSRSPLSQRVAARMVRVYGVGLNVLTRPAGSAGGTGEGRAANGSAARARIAKCSGEPDLPQQRAFEVASVRLEGEA